MTELVVIIVITGILAAVVLPRFQGESGFEARALRDKTVAALRYAHKSAIAARRTVCGTFSSTGVSFRVATGFPSSNCSAGTDLEGPEGGALTVAVAGQRYSAFPVAGVFFGADGRPAAGASIAVEGLPSPLDIQIESETGYVH